MLNLPNKIAKMDIMKPQLLQIGNICYRKNAVERVPYGGKERGSQKDHQLGEEGAYYSLHCCLVIRIILLTIKQDATSLFHG